MFLFLSVLEIVLGLFSFDHFKVSTRSNFLPKTTSKVENRTILTIGTLEVMTNRKKLTSL